MHVAVESGLPDEVRVVEANAATVSEESLLLIVYCVHPCKLPRLPTGVNVELVYLGALVTSIYRIVEWIGGIGDVYELRLSDSSEAERRITPMLVSRTADVVLATTYIRVTALTSCVLVM